MAAAIHLLIKMILLSDCVSFLVVLILSSARRVGWLSVPCLKAQSAGIIPACPALE